MSKYDEVPYLSLPYPASHPRNLQALATLFGMRPAPLAECRVLELGCASGGNLLPCAEAFPNATFLGIDASQRQISSGQEATAAAALRNLELRQASILDVDRSWGLFDYLICHGVYSWVERDVQDQILRICQRNLAPQGVALVSYNTYPGWHLRAAVRDMMRYHVTQFETPPEMIRQARGMLDFMVSACNEAEPYGQLLKQELERLQRVDDSYIFHEHLEEANQPLEFHELVARAGRFNLQYLAESNLTRMFPLDQPPHVQQALDGSPLIRQEQYLDYLRNTSFRMTLLVHAEHPLQREQLAERLTAFRVAWQEAPDSSGLDRGEGDHAERTIRIGTREARLRRPDVATVVDELTAAWPQFLGVRELVERCSRRETVAAGTREASAALRQFLLEAWVADLLVAFVEPPAFASKVTELPYATPLVRWQARGGGAITNRWHQPVRIDALGRFVLQRLDGQHDRTALENALRAALADGILAAQVDDQKLQLDDQKVAEIVQWALRASVDLRLLSETP